MATITIILNNGSRLMIELNNQIENLTLQDESSVNPVNAPTMDNNEPIQAMQPNDASGASDTDSGNATIDTSDDDDVIYISDDDDVISISSEEDSDTGSISTIWDIDGERDWYANFPDSLNYLRTYYYSTENLFAGEDVPY